MAYCFEIGLLLYWGANVVALAVLSKSPVARRCVRASALMLVLVAAMLGLEFNPFARLLVPKLATVTTLVIVAPGVLYLMEYRWVLVFGPALLLRRGRTPDEAIRALTARRGLSFVARTAATSLATMHAEGTYGRWRFARNALAVVAVAVAIASLLQYVRRWAAHRFGFFHSDAVTAVVPYVVAACVALLAALALVEFVLRSLGYRRPSAGSTAAGRGEEEER
jgi:hypothetical protein